MGKKIFSNFMLKKLVYLNLCDAFAKSKETNNFNLWHHVWEWYDATYIKTVTIFSNFMELYGMTSITILHTQWQNLNDFTLKYNFKVI